MSQPLSAGCAERCRNLLYLRSPELWAAWPFLPLVRRRPGHEEECGLLYDVFHSKGVPGHGATVFFGNLFLLPREDEFLNLPREVYDNLEEVYAAGWRVD